MDIKLTLTTEEAITIVDALKSHLEGVDTTLEAFPNDGHLIKEKVDIEALLIKLVWNRN